MPCFLCGSQGVKERWPGGEQTIFDVDCRACGQYQINMVLAADIDVARANFQEWLPYLAAHTRQANAMGTRASLTHDNFKALASGHRHTPVGEKMRRVLEHLGKRSSVPGDLVTVDPDAHPLFDVAERGHVGFLLDALEQRGDIHKHHRVNSAGQVQWTVTVQGWDRLNPSAPGGVPGSVFVAMASGADMQSAYDGGIVPAVTEDCGLTITLSIRVQHNDSINDLILAGIRGAQVVIADVTHQRNGVYFEGGFAMGLGRVVVWMCRANDVENIHFDTRQYNHVVWTDQADLREKLAARLRATVGVPAKA